MKSLVLVQSIFYANPLDIEVQEEYRSLISFYLETHLMGYHTAEKLIEGMGKTIDREIAKEIDDSNNDDKSKI